MRDRRRKNGETPVDETPVNEVPVTDETPVDETPVGETPVNETPMDETPVDEVPVDETPMGDETPETDEASTAAETPARGQPEDDPAQQGVGRGPAMDPGRMVGPNRTRSRKPRRGWNLGYFLREGFVSIFRHGLMSFAAVCMIVACLLIMGTFTLVAVNLDANFKELEQKNEFSAYLDESLSDSAVRALESDLLAIDNVRQVQFVDRREVLAEFRAQRPDDQGLFALLPDDTFRHRYRVYVTDLERLAETMAAVEAVPGVADTSGFVEGAEGMVALRNVAAGVALILVAILAVVSLFIIANTLRLAAFYRRDEIAIMRMCGATNGFICWPFVAEGAMLGLFSAALAFGLQWVIYNMIAKAMASAGQLGFLVVVDFQRLWPGVLCAFCGGGLLIGVLGSLLAIRRFLKV